MRPMPGPSAMSHFKSKAAPASKPGVWPGNTDAPLQEGHRLAVLQVTPELNAGGVERTTLEVAAAIDRAGGLALVASAGGRLEPDLEAAGGELIRLPVNSKNPISALANAFTLASLIRRRGVDIVHARSRAPAWSALLAARMTGAAFVTTYHGIYNARSHLKRFYNSVMARGDLVIANSEYTRAHVMETHGLAAERVVAIPRGVDLDAFDRGRVPDAHIAAMRASWGIPAADKAFVLLAPARLTRWKGQLHAIEAVRLIQARRPGAVRLVLAGDAQGRAAYVGELRAAIDAAGLGRLVVLAGHVADMPAAFAAANAALFPVVEPEAFGRGAVEAQAMAVPPVASRLGGFTETIIDGDTGFLTSPGSAPELAAAVERLLDMGSEARSAMGRRACERARALYAKTALQEATLEIYHRLLRETANRNLGETGRQRML